MNATATPSQQAQPYYPSTKFTGRLWHESHQVDCTLVAEIADDGRLSIRIDDIPMEEGTLFLSDLFFGRPSLAFFNLDAVSDDGHRLTSDRFHFESMRREDVRVYTNLVGRCTTAKIVKKREVSEDDSGRLTFLVRGFWTFRTLQAATPFGMVEMDGPSREDNAKLNSFLELHTTSERVIDQEKRQELVDFMEHMIFIISFARGTLLRDPVRMFVYEDKVEIEVRRLSAGPRSFFSLVHDVSQQPIFAQAVEGFSTRYAARKEMRVVIEFMLMGSEYTDARLMMNAVAVEFLTNKYLDDDDRKELDPKQSQRIKIDLRAALKASKMAEEDKKYVKQVVGDANKMPLKGKIEKLITKWDLPMVDLPQDMIQNLVLVRNAIAHGRILSEDEETKHIDNLEMMLAVRELLTRIILLRIGYEGAYTSYLGGQVSRLSPSFKRQ